MAQSLVELCSILVENAFGEMASQIFNVFANRGRMNLSNLSHLTHEPPGRLKPAILTLVQHHIIYHATEDHYGDSPTYFTVDWHAAYALLRSQKLLLLVQEREGESAGRIFDQIQQLGHVSIGHLAERCGLASALQAENGVDSSPASKPDSGIDVDAESERVHQKETSQDFIGGKGPSLGDVNTLPKLHSLLKSLLKQGYLLKVTDHDHLHPADLELLIKEAVIDESFRDGKITGPKKSVQFRSDVNDLKRKWQEEDQYSEVKDVDARGNIKRAKTDDHQLNGGAPTNDLPNGHVSNGIHRKDDDRDPVRQGVIQLLPNDMVVRVDTRKFVKAFRTQRLEQEATQLLGPVTGIVYGAFLRAVEVDGETSPNRETFDGNDAAVDSDDEEDPDDHGPGDYRQSVPDSKVLKQLNQSIALSSNIKGTEAYDRLTNGEVIFGDEDDTAQNGVKQEKRSGDEGEHDDEDLPSKEYTERKKRLALIDTHLHILCEHPHKFCVRSPTSPNAAPRPSTKSADVNFTEISEKLIANELERIVLTRLGPTAHRVVRILRFYEAKLDEKQLADMCWKPLESYMRPLLTKMHRHGLLETQELPRDNTRQPSKAAFLWFFDEERMRGAVVQQMYHAMARALQRVQVEREGKFAGVLEKVAVSGEAKLNQREKEMLERWMEVEARLMAQVARLDDLVALFRDFGGLDTSLLT